jgi:hypothetical protein
MKIERSPHLYASLGVIALSLLVAGCSSDAGSLPTSPTTITAQRTDRGTASSQKLYVSTLDGGSVIVYSAGPNPQLLQTITDGVPRPGGIWIDGNGVLYAVNVPGGNSQTSLPEYEPGAGSPALVQRAR